MLRKHGAVLAALLLQSLVVVLALYELRWQFEALMFIVISALMLLALVFIVKWRTARARLRWVERTVVNVLDCDGRSVDVSVLVLVLGSEKVFEASDNQRKRYEELTREQSGR